jgi:primosomal protein N'
MDNKITKCKKCGFTSPKNQHCEHHCGSYIISERNALTARVAELEAVLKSISSFAGSLPDQFPEHLEDEISLIHNEAIENIYDMTLAALEAKS